jgi:vanillate O-demethylase monooxygenase subunit
VACNYELETDNLMDLSHVEYLHGRSFGGRGVIQRGEQEVREDGADLYSSWWMPNVPVVNPMTGTPTGDSVDHFLDMRWSAPCSMRLKVGFVPLGKYASRSRGPRDDLPGQFSAHIITPETDHTCHYFWSADRPSGAGPFADGGDAEQGRALFKLAFELEDKPMLEAVDANMDKDFWEQQPVMLRNDVGAVRTRRRLAKLIADEQAPVTEQMAALDTSR